MTIPGLGLCFKDPTGASEISAAGSAVFFSLLQLCVLAGAGGARAAAGKPDSKLSSLETRGLN